MESENYKEIANEAIEIAQNMLKELYFLRVHEMIYDQFDVSINKLKCRLLCNCDK